MKRNDGWTNALVALVFIAVPAVILYYFLLPDWTNKEVISLGASMGIAIGFIAFTIAWTSLFIKFEILPYQALNFNIPVALGLMMLFVTYDLTMWARVLLLILVILLAFPVNMMTDKLITSKRRKLNKK